MISFIADLPQDLRHAFRALSRAPGVTAAVIAMLALGIGANAAMYGILDTLFLRAPVHIVDPAGVTHLWIRQKSFFGSGSLLRPGMDFNWYTALQKLRTAALTAAYTSSREQRLGHGPDAEKSKVSFVTGNLFAFLGVRPALGRLLTPTDDSAGAPPAAVIGYDYWRRRFDGQRSAIGKTFTLSDVVYTIVGVAPEGFSGPEPDAADVWVPVQIAGPADHGPRWRESMAGGTPLNVLARARAGLKPVAVADEATTVLRALSQGPYGDPKLQVLPGSLLPTRTPDGLGRGTQLPLVVAGVSLIVLLIACANAANLLLLRAAGRRREIAVRRALGASEARLSRLLVTESVALCAIAGAGAVGVALVAGRILRVTLLPRYSWAAGSLGGQVVLFVVAVALLIGLAVGFIPVWQSARADAVNDLKAGARSAPRARSPVRTSLLVIQAALSLALLVGTALFIRSFNDARHMDLGFDLDRLVSVVLNHESARDWWSPLPQAAVTQLADRVRVLPGVDAVAISTGGLMSSWGATSVKVPGLEKLPQGDGPYVNGVTPNYFAVVGLKMQRGRAFTEADGPGPKVAIVNAAMAQVFWPGQEPIGRCLVIGDSAACSTVIGIVEDARERGVNTSGLPPMRQYYVPLEQEPMKGAFRSLVIRTAGSPARLVVPIQREVAVLFPELPRDRVTSVADIFAAQIRQWRVGTGLFGCAALLAVLLAAIGLYSVVAYGVRMREQEFGVRRALGAQTWDLVEMVLRQSLVPVAAGLVVGVGLALWGSKFVAPLLFEGHKPRDPAAFVAAVVVLLLASLAASIIPARLAARVDPRIALQAE